MANNLTVTILRGEYEYLLKCKKRAEGLRRSQKKWVEANRDHVRTKARQAYKNRKEKGKDE